MSKSLLSCKGSPCIGYTESRLKELDFDPCTSRNSWFCRGLMKLSTMEHDEIRKAAVELKRYKLKIPSSTTYPSGITIAIAEEQEAIYEDVENKLKKALDLKTPQTRYEVELCFFILLQELQKETALTDIKEQQPIQTAADPSATSAIEIIKILSEMLYLNRPEDEEKIEAIKALLIGGNES